MLTWIAENTEVLNLAANVAMVVIWLAYLHVFLRSFRRQTRPKIVINLAAGSTLDAACFISNMSSEPIYVESIVAKLEVDVHPDLLNTVRFHKPTQGFRGKFSLDYVLAAMLLDARVDLDSFSDEYCNSPRMRASLDKVQINTHPEWGDDPTSRRRAPVTITMNDGRKFTKTVDKVRGSPGNPMTRDELIAKYHVCASRVLAGERLERSISALENLEKLGSVSELMDTLTA